MDSATRREWRPPGSPRSRRASARSRRSQGSVDSRLVLRLRLARRVRDVLAKGVPVDLHPNAFKAGRCREHDGRSHRHADRYARRCTGLSAHCAAQHGGQLLVVAHIRGGGIRLRRQAVGVRMSHPLDPLFRPRSVAPTSTPRREGAGGKLAPEELRGSTFTVTSAGKLAGLFVTPLVNYPEVAILGIHGSARARSYVTARWSCARWGTSA